MSGVNEWCVSPWVIVNKCMSTYAGVGKCMSESIRVRMSIEWIICDCMYGTMTVSAYVCVC